MCETETQKKKAGTGKFPVCAHMRSVDELYKVVATRTIRL